VRSKVGVYRLQLFKPSETFITNQVRQYRQYEHVYLGRRCFNPLRPASIVMPRLSPLQLADFMLLRNPSYHQRTLAETKLDLIHAHFAVDAVYALPLSKVLGIPLITTFHGFDVTSPDSMLLKSVRPAPINSVLHRKRLQREGAWFLCASDFLRRAALRKGFPPERLSVHYVGIDTDAIEARQDAGEDGLIVHVARLVEVKGTAYLLRALQILRTGGTKARLMVIGDGPLNADLRRLARELGISDFVTFAGMLPNTETLAWIKRAAVLAMPSITTRSGIAEAFGIVNLEAAASAVPVVAFDSGGIGEAIVDGETGLLTSEGDCAALATNIAVLLADPQRRLAMGCLARQHAHDNFRIQTQTALLEKIYDEVRLRYAYARAW
jgi:glycosyltransferase involved in cell wall biosynthesis